ncbi:XrtA/PEP-CTERM system TPR-repeat protein PrsT [Roseomonas sp. CCTCC AB2023176]|uniref:XrtA/PEP-CTERM system TPR-repeat protein PrsT n=1 Tax=Roseomonas sp. CCTCC AB2023176 TaxID=3342640 RepID=UPI0035DF78DA
MMRKQHLALAVMSLLAATPGYASVDAARGAQARGDLRAAQIEYRNAVRRDPNDAALRAALAQASLDVGDGDTAEKEARAALERGFDRASGTWLILRAYLLLNRERDLLRDFPAPAENVEPNLGARVAAGRALAQLTTGDRDGARQSVETALRLAPSAVRSQLAAASLALASDDAAGAEAALDRALQADPNNAEAIARKAALAMRRGDANAAIALTDPLVAREPGNVPVRLIRGEAFLRLNDNGRARTEVDAALRTAPTSAQATYLRAVLLGRAEDWRGADEAFQRLGGSLVQFPDGYYLAAVTKRALGQTAQAEDFARRHVARRPEDVRAAIFLAAMEMEAGRPDAAAGTLTRLASRGAADAQAYDLLGRAHLGAGRPRQAADAFARASAMAPTDSGILSRLAAARLAAGDNRGTTEAADNALRASPEAAGARQMLAAAALARGDVALAEAELSRLDEAGRANDVAQVLIGTIRVIHLDMAGGRTAFEAALRANPESVAARNGLARVALAEDRPDEAERLLGEVLRREPGNRDALTRIASVAVARGPRSAESLAVLQAAQAANPPSAELAVALANALNSVGEPARAAAVLEADALKDTRAQLVPMMLGQIRAGQGNWEGAEAATRSALAINPDATIVRRQLATILQRRGDARGAEALIEDGLRTRPDDAVLQSAAVDLAQAVGGVDGALAMADRLAARANAMPTAASLRGDVLRVNGRTEEAAQAYAAAFGRAPSALLAARLASAWTAAGKPDRAAAALDEWLRTRPTDPGALSARAALDIGAGREAQAEERLARVVEAAPTDSAALNNLAWLLQKKGDPASVDRARALAERAYFLSPTPEIADTLATVVLRQGEPRTAVWLLRQAVASPEAARARPGIATRYATALRAAGRGQDAPRYLEAALTAGNFAERPQAERLLAELRAGG